LFSAKFAEICLHEFSRGFTKNNENAAAYFYFLEPLTPPEQTTPKSKILTLLAGGFPHSLHKKMTACGAFLLFHSSE
jgi:hypothetical protein